MKNTTTLAITCFLSIGREKPRAAPWQREGGNGITKVNDCSTPVNPPGIAGTTHVGAAALGRPGGPGYRAARLAVQREQLTVGTAALGRPGGPGYRAARPAVQREQLTVGTAALGRPGGPGYRAARLAVQREQLTVGTAALGRPG